VDQVVGVEADAEKVDKRVVAAGKQEQRDHVHDGKNTSSVTGIVVPKLGVTPFNSPDAESNLHAEVTEEEQCLETTREGAHVGSGRKLELAVVTLLPERCGDNVTLDLCVAVVGNAEVLLLAVAGCAVVEVGESAHVAKEDKSPSVDQHGGDDGDPSPSSISHDLGVGLGSNGVVGDLGRRPDWRRSHGVW